MSDELQNLAERCKDAKGVIDCIADPNGTLKAWLADVDEMNEFPESRFVRQREYHTMRLNQDMPRVSRCPQCGVVHVVDELYDPFGPNAQPDRKEP